MKEVAERVVAVLDANVLFPFRKRDLLLRFSHAGLFRPRWTATILDEWTRGLLAQKPSLEASIRAQLAAIRKHFPDAPVSGYEPLVKALDLPDPDDRHVLAAAIRCSASCIVTDNLADFPAEILAGFDIEAFDADEFLTRTFDRYPAEVLLLLRELRSVYKNPSFTASEFVDDLIAKGMPRLAGRACRHRDFL